MILAFLRGVFNNH